MSLFLRILLGMHPVWHWEEGQRAYLIFCNGGMSPGLPWRQWGHGQWMPGSERGCTREGAESRGQPHKACGKVTLSLLSQCREERMRVSSNGGTARDWWAFLIYYSLCEHTHSNNKLSSVWFRMAISQFLSFFAVLGIGPRASSMLGKCCTTELPPDSWSLKTSC